ncbi:MAG: flagellar biosynthetic protein FliR [Kofleriaceae bacterium]
MQITDPEIGAFVATLARAGGLVATAPVVGDNGVPPRAKLVFVLVIAFTVAPNRPGIPLADVGLVAILELCVGLLTGLCARFIIARAAVAGQLFGLTLGLGFASQYDINAGESASTLRTILATISALVFLSVGGLEAIVQSATTAPASIIHVGLLGPALLEHGAAAMGRGLALAAPVILATLVGNIGLALISRAAPAANIFAIALAGVIVIGGLAMLATSGDLLAGLTGDAREAVDVLVGGSP